MRVDKTYAELWNLVNEHEDNEVQVIAQMAIKTIQKLQKENEKFRTTNPPLREGEMNQLRRKLDEMKGKLEEALLEKKQQNNLNKELNGCLTWHIEANERYEKALEEIAEFGGTDLVGKSCAKLAKAALA